MDKYRSVPMDLADATLVALAESLGQKKIFTLDSDFEIYRMTGRKSFDIVP
jgi:predicted nucleic acid-binding protein